MKGVYWDLSIGYNHIDTPLHSHKHLQKGTKEVLCCAIKQVVEGSKCLAMGFQGRPKHMLITHMYFGPFGLRYGDMGTRASEPLLSFLIGGLSEVRFIAYFNAPLLFCA
jgi:hypothetical protein